MSPEGLITSEFDDAAIIDTEVDAAAVVEVDAEDPDGLADLELVVLALAGMTVEGDGLVESAYTELTADRSLHAAPGAEDLIRRLRSVGVAVVLTTGFSRATLDTVLDALGWRDLADLTLTPSEAGRGRPYPDLPLTALLRTGASSVEGMVVVGDSASDITSGLAAGAGLVVGVLTGAHDEATLIDAGADAVVAGVADLAALLGLDDLEARAPEGQTPR